MGRFLRYLLGYVGAHQVANAGDPGESPFKFGELFFKDVDTLAEPMTPVDLAKIIRDVGSGHDKAGSGDPEAHGEHPTLEECEGSKMVMLYSAWCPHCHNFAPRWLEFSRLTARCKTSEPVVGAFECSSTAEKRSSSHDEWAKAGFTEIADPSILPATAHDICYTFLESAYPTIAAFVPNSCHLHKPAQRIPLDSVENLIPWMKIDEVSFYRIPVDRLGKSAGSVFDAFRASGLLKECDGVTSLKGNLTELDRQNVQYILDSLPDPEPLETSTRWAPEAQTMSSDARIHDAVIGIYFILKEWVFGDPTRGIDATQMIAVKNFLKLLSVLPGEEVKQKLGALSATLEPHREISVRVMRDSVQNLTIYNVPDLAPGETVLRQDRSLTCQSQLCLVWTLMHVIVQRIADVVKENPHLHSIEFQNENEELPTFSKITEGGAIINPSLVPTILHQIVMSFFNCESCRDHFHAAYQAGAADMIQWTTEGVPSDNLQGGAAEPAHGAETVAAGAESSTRALPTRALPGTGSSMLEKQAEGTRLWFWRFHNIVDLRTALDAVLSNIRQQIAMETRRRDVNLLYDGEDVRFPTRAMCPDCYVQTAEKSFYMSKKIVDSFLFVHEDEAQMRYDRYQEFNLTHVATALDQIYGMPDVLKHQTSQSPNPDSPDSNLPSLKWEASPDGNDGLFVLSPSKI